jgi:hypothetical protein
MRFVAGANGISALTTLWSAYLYYSHGAFSNLHWSVAYVWLLVAAGSLSLVASISSARMKVVPLVLPALASLAVVGVMLLAHYYASLVLWLNVAVVAAVIHVAVLRRRLA